MTTRFKELQSLYRLLGGLSKVPISIVSPKEQLQSRVKLTRRLNRDMEMIAY